MEKGEIKYSEVVRENVRKLEAYVEEMASGDTVSGAVNIQKVQDDVLKLWSVFKALPEISSDQKNHIKSLYEGVLRSLNNLDSNPRSAPRSRRSSSQFLRPQVTGVTAVTSLSSDKIPLLHLKRKVGNTWEYSSNLTGVYLDILHEIATSGTTFKDKNALLTGVGKGSIGVEVVKGLLSVVILSLDQLKSYFHCPATTVFSEMMACTPSPRYPLKLFFNDGPLKVGVNTSVWLVQSLGKSSIFSSQHFANNF